MKLQQTNKFKYDFMDGSVNNQVKVTAYCGPDITL